MNICLRFKIIIISLAFLNSLMKRCVLFVAIFALSVSSFAQKIQFGNNTNVWGFVDSTIGCCIPTPTVYTTAYYDSLPITFNGQTYQNLIASIGNALTRQVGDKVYIVYATDSTEQVL